MIRTGDKKPNCVLINVSLVDFDNSHMKMKCNLLFCVCFETWLLIIKWPKCLKWENWVFFLKLHVCPAEGRVFRSLKGQFLLVNFKSWTFYIFLTIFKRFLSLLSLSSVTWSMFTTEGSFQQTSEWLTGRNRRKKSTRRSETAAASEEEQRSFSEAVLQIQPFKNTPLQVEVLLISNMYF